MPAAGGGVARGGVGDSVHLVVVSDAHLLGPEDPEQVALCAFLDGLRCDRLVLLGDMLHAGWTWGGPHPDHRPFFSALERVCARGVGVWWVPGNHDFGVQVPPAVQAAGAHVVDCDGRRLLLAHGDEPDRSVGYRALRGVLRSRVFAGLISGLGPDRGMALLRRMAGPRHPPEATPPRGLVTAQREWAARQLRDPGLDGVIMGHSHVLGEVALPGGTLWHTGAWLGLRSWLEVIDGQVRLHGAGG